VGTIYINAPYAALGCKYSKSCNLFIKKVVAFSGQLGYLDLKMFRPRIQITGIWKWEYE
jgi:hypothetical protein